MIPLIWIIVSSLILALVSLAGGLALVITGKKFNQLIMYLVSFSAGALLAGALVHLLPESFEKIANSMLVSLLVLSGLVSFYILEQFISWHHCHRSVGEHVHPVSYLILIADGVHNLIDGLAVGSAFMIDYHLGIATLIAVVAHEVPQELGDFGILIHSGWTARRALVFNLLSSLTFFIGAIITYFLSKEIEIVYLLPIAAGSFIYIAAVDLLPQVNKACEQKPKLAHFLSFVLGTVLLIVLKIFFE
ncbi:MAG: ZIP family metal transporter [Patescibacteria group bacterium]